MSKTKSTIQKSIKILEYKILYQEKEKVFLEFEEGSIDLNYRLSFFQEKLDKSINSQIELFKNNIMPNNKNNITQIVEDENKVDLEYSSNNNKENLQNESVNKNDIPDWIKKIYRKIINITHPDKTSGIKSKDIIRNYTEYYYLVVSSLEKKEYENILMIANDLMIDMNDISIDEFDNIFDKSIMSKKNEIIEKKTKMGYYWYHIPEDKKDNYLKMILINLGFIFTEEKIQEAIRTKRPIDNLRKPGERPGKGILDRRKNNGKH